MIFLAGGSGFLGQHLLAYLCRLNVPVLASYNSTPGSFQDKNIEYIQIDLEDVFAIEDVFEKYAIDMVIDLAARISYDKNNALKLITYNRDITAHLVNKSLEYNIRYLKMSSIAALGESKSSDDIISEDSEWNYKSVHSAYALSKKLSEMEVWRGAAEGLEVMVLYPGIIIGLGNEKSMSDQFTRNITKEQKYYSYGETLYVDVDDVCRAVMQCIDSWLNEGYFIIGKNNLSFKNLLDDVAEVFGYTPPQKELKKWMAGVFRFLYNIKNKLRGQKGFLSPETMAMLFKVKRYASNKFTDHYTNFEYTSMENTLKKIQEELASGA